MTREDGGTVRDVTHDLYFLDSESTSPNLSPRFPTTGVPVFVGLRLTRMFYQVSLCPIPVS